MAGGGQSGEVTLGGTYTFYYPTSNHFSLEFLPSQKIKKNFFCHFLAKKNRFFWAKKNLFFGFFEVIF